MSIIASKKMRRKARYGRHHIRHAVARRAAKSATADGHETVDMSRMLVSRLAARCAMMRAATSTPTSDMKRARRAPPCRRATASISIFQDDARNGTAGASARQAGDDGSRYGFC